MRIYLIGFMGSGKSTLGKWAALHFHAPFVDTDLEIEQREGMRISDIFIDKGEFYFRDLENEIIRSTQNLSKSIIATGGGLPCHGDNMEWMLTHGITLYLQWPIEVLKRRLMKEREDRPLLSSLELFEASERIEKLFEQRRPDYEKASMTIEMKGNVDEDLMTLIKACNYIW